MTTRQYIDYLRNQRSRLAARLFQVEQAEWNWPSTRARCEVMRVQKELDDVDSKLFVRPIDEDVPVEV